MPGLMRGARVAIWGGSRVRGDAGVQAAQGVMAYTVYEVPALPDFSSSRFPDLQGLEKAKRVADIGARQSQFLSALHPLGPTMAVSLRYFCRTVAGREPELRVFLVVRNWASDDASALAGIEKARETVRQAFPAHYRLVEFDEARDPDAAQRVIDLDGAMSLVEILKMEQKIPTWHDARICGFPFYYRVSFFEPLSNDMVEFCRGLTTKASGRDVVVDITLTPTRPLTDVERGELQTWRGLCERWGKEQRIEVPGGLFSKSETVEIAEDPHALEVGRTYQEMITRYGGAQRLFVYAIRVASWELAPPREVASALAAAALGAGAPYWLQATARSTGNDQAFQKALNAARLQYATPAMFNENIWLEPDAPETLRRLHRLVEVGEVEGFFRVPIPGREGCPGIPLDSGVIVGPARASAKDALLIGSVIRDNRVTLEKAEIPLRDLAKSALVVGMPGSGKTTFCFSLLRQLWEEHRIPFIVVEPAKTEYRSLVNLPSLARELLVFTVGNERVAPFRFNPFEVPPGIGVSEHISVLNTCFAGAFSLWDPLPMILDEAIREAYLERGWSEFGVAGEEPGLEPPSMEDLYEHSLRIARKTSYQGETAGNIRGALEARLGVFLRGPKGRCFNCRKSFPIEVLMERPTVLELDWLNDEEKALAMMFVLTAVREYARATRRSGAMLSHVLVLEEAHNVIGRGGGAGGGDSVANPKEVAVRFFTRMLAEMRALGEGMIVADQLPTAIAAEAIKITNVKVMHRLVSADDREELGRAMILDEGQVELAAVLSPGRSLVHMEGWAKSRLVAEPDFKAEFGVEEPPPDAAVQERMAVMRRGEAVSDCYVPYPACLKLCRECDAKVREAVERFTSGIQSSLGGTLEGEPREFWAAIARDEFLEGMRRNGMLDGMNLGADAEVRMFCAVVHLEEKLVKRLVGGRP